MSKVLIIHGAGMTMRGKSQIDVFGPMTLAEYNDHIRSYASELGVSIDICSSNTEGEVIDRLYQAHDSAEVDGAVINPAGFTTGYPALVAAIAQVRYPVFEVHMSNPARRGRVSEIATASQGVLAGFGIFGYYLALSGIVNSQ